MATLTATGLSKSYAGTPVLQGFTHAFAEGKITTLLGPSGSGKSTTLNLIAGLTSPDEGRIALDGDDITHVPAEKRGFGLIFQNYALFPHLNVRDNIAFGLRVRGLSSADQKKRVGEMLDLLRIPHLAERRVHQISGGEQQRVAMARALAFRPRVLLMDEPFSALDAQLRDQLRGELACLLGELAITTVYVTHDQVEAMSLGHEMIILQQGRIAQSGAPREIYLRPANTMVATFLGQANVLAAILEGAGSEMRLRFPFAVIPLPNATHPAGECRVLLRPEDLEVVTPSEAHFTATWESSSFLGNRLRLVLRTGETRLIVEGQNDLQISDPSAVPVRIRMSRISFLPS
jgi:putative spermidine/putrescine transport system ATP-binding protein